MSDDIKRAVDLLASLDSNKVKTLLEELDADEVGDREVFGFDLDYEILEGADPIEMTDEEGEFLCMLLERYGNFECRINNEPGGGRS